MLKTKEDLKQKLETFKLILEVLWGISLIYISSFYLFKVRYIPLFTSNVSLLYIFLLGMFLALLASFYIFAFLGPSLILYSSSLVADDKNKTVRLISRIYRILIYLMIWFIVALFLLVPFFDKYFIPFLFYPILKAFHFSLSNHVKILLFLLLFSLVLLFNYAIYRIYKKFKRKLFIEFVAVLSFCILIITSTIILFVRPEAVWYPLKRLNLYGNFTICFKQKSILKQMSKQCNIMIVSNGCVSQEVVNNFKSILIKCNSSYIEIPSSEIYLISKN